jgi:hypothetical protein
MQLLSWLSARMTFRPQTRCAPAARASRVCRPEVNVLEGRDLPSFAAPVVYPSTATIALVTGDVNGDGRPDLTYAKQNGEEIVVQLGNRNGTFDAPIYGSGGGAPLGPTTALAVGPFRGKPSIWVAHDTIQADFGNEIADFSIFQLTTQITKTKGNKTTSKTVLTDVADWYPGEPYQGGAIPGPISSLAVADLDGNGGTDLVAVSTHGWGPYSGNVYVALSDSTGFFGNDQSYWIPPANSVYGQAQATVGDLNGDGKPDIIVTDPPLNAVGVLVNNGNGTFFGTSQTYAVGGTPAAVAVGDVNGDGKLDIVTANANANGTVSVLLNAGNGSFGAAQNYAVGGPANSVALGDFNHDGRLDIATAGAELDVMLGNGDGTFGAAQKVGPAGNHVSAVDVNGDGFLDLVQIDGSNTGIDVLTNKADWSNGH